MICRGKYRGLSAIGSAQGELAQGEVDAQGLLLVMIRLLHSFR
jgi:hypothetical protein